MAKILLIEDEPEHIKVIRIRLEANGFQVIAAENAKNGIRSALLDKPDLILMDILLPDMSGLKAIRRLKELRETEDIPIVAITAVRTPDIGRDCYAAGACDVIGKPYDDRDLLDKIKRALEK